jgi:hypothetical protein
MLGQLCVILLLCSLLRSPNLSGYIHLRAPLLSVVSLFTEILMPDRAPLFNHKMFIALTNITKSCNYSHGIQV